MEKEYFMVAFNTPDYTSIHIHDNFDDAKKEFEDEREVYESEDNMENTMTFAKIVLPGTIYFGIEFDESNGNEVIEEIGPF